MSYQQQNKAPEGCVRPDRCGHLEEIVGPDQQPHDRCLRGVPMHNGCAWHTAGTVMLVQANSLPRA